MKKVLVVDDSKGWVDYHLSAFKEIYGEAQVALFSATCAKEAYDVVYNNLNEPFDLIVSDLQMEMAFEPKHAGEWFVEQVLKLKEYKNTKIVIISAAYNIRTIALKLGVDCLPKAIAARDLTSYKLKMDELLN